MIVLLIKKVRSYVEIIAVYLPYVSTNYSFKKIVTYIAIISSKNFK